MMTTILSERTRRRTCLILGLALLSMIAHPFDSSADEARPKAVEKSGASQPDDVGPPAAPERKPAPIAVYVPPTSRGSARATVGAGTRARDLKRPRIEVVAPNDHVALTTRAQPTLYWFVSEPTSDRIDVTIVDEEAVDPLLELTLPAPVEAGFHALRVEDYGLSLAPETTYRWYLTLVVDPNRRSGDRVEGGVIERTRVTGELGHALDRSLPAYVSYASAGIWYDAIDTLFEAIALAPADQELLRQRRAFLDQVDLSDISGPTKPSSM